MVSADGTLYYRVGCPGEIQQLLMLLLLYENLITSLYHVSLHCTDSLYLYHRCEILDLIEGIFVGVLFVCG